MSGGRTGSSGSTGKPEPAQSALAAVMLAGGNSVQRFVLPGGTLLIEAGQVSGALYLLRSGRLAAIERRSDGSPRLLNLIRPGEGIGEISLLGGIPHSATVIALRDSEVLSMPRAAFFEVIRREPAVMLELVQTLIRRTQSQPSAGQGPTAFAFTAASAQADIKGFSEQLANRVRAFGSRVAVLDAKSRPESTDWFSRIEEESDYLFYVAERGEVEWAKICCRQSDWIFHVAPGDATADGLAPAAAIAGLLKRTDLILLHKSTSVAVDVEGCRKKLGADRIYHTCPSVQDDVARLARLLTGRSTGLVLSGGGARGYAHIGAIRALRELGVPLDYLAGTSMGAVIAAGAALGWDDQEMDTRVREAFVASNPLGDLTLPLLALTRGAKVQTRLFSHFGDRDIADLWLPFFCVSSDLTRGVPVVHNRGPLVSALRASIALPGVLPPVCEGGTVLVDGGVMRNLPADMMRAEHAGPIIAVDVSIDAGISPADIEVPRSLWTWLLSGAWRKGPPIVSLLLRSGTVTAERDLLAARHVADVLVLPKLENVEIGNWRAFEPAVAAGYAATKAALDQIAVPVTELRIVPNRGSLRS